eukprot:CAMPEP_0197455552 /NCGR_PEP_ID=MMETSP1175-20131217/41066_1 /TAXON_ID=1003142 /ORGANISM="Triceratium dubium, Strain CCMP147" /LENGTH=32 /DNA_ID= /DNA_START= /DNA_END= /DNA_ORIENTATION=
MSPKFTMKHPDRGGTSIQSPPLVKICNPGLSS